METLVRLNREQGVTIIVVTHEPDIAAYADRTLTMRDGQIVSDERNPKLPWPSNRRAARRQALARRCAQPPRAVLATARRTDTFWASP